jgi:hypothetical protein
MGEGKISSVYKTMAGEDSNVPVIFKVFKVWPLSHQTRFTFTNPDELSRWSRVNYCFTVSF